VVANGTPFADFLDDFGDGPGAADVPVSLPTTLNGSAGDDFLGGGPGNDTLNGGAGSDTLTGDDTDQSQQQTEIVSDADVLSGGDGNDSLNPSNGTNTVSGGAGIDDVFYNDNIDNAADTAFVATPVSVSLDGVANDGYAGNNSNIATDVEDVTVTDDGGVNCAAIAPEPCAYGGAFLAGDSGPNMLAGGSGDDTLTGGGGGDFLSGNAGTNTLNGVNGYPDRLDCGGTGTANADQLDTVVACTTVNTTKLANVGLLTQDKAPTVSWASPKEKAKINPSKTNTFQVNATAGTHPITKVVYYIGERTACISTTAPYKCAYKGKDTDVGKDTLVAIATDSIGLTSTLTRSITVSTFKPKKLSASTKPKTAKHAPFVFTTSGKLTLPTGVSKGKGCTGSVSVTYKDGKKKVGSGSTRLHSNCSFSSKMKVAVPKGTKALSVSVVFGGNTTLSKASAKGYKVKIG
jgi:hypothetical protein